MGTSGPAPNGAVAVSSLVVGAPVRHGQGIDLPPARPSSRAEGDGGAGEGGASHMNSHGINSQLLFFDTFSHEVIEELNLDLVQFPSPVIVDEVRVIPLGARVQANFPGGVRLGATNPTRFELECFVNDLSTPGASTFEPLGVLHYDHNARIHLRPSEYHGRGGSLNSRKIPTDGLVLRGFYNAITLAVYGTFSKSTAEQLAQAAQQQNAVAAAQDSQIASAPDVTVSTPPSSQRSLENHTSPLIVVQPTAAHQPKPSPQEQQSQPPQSHMHQGQNTAVWAAAASQQANHDALVASWASSAAANLHHQQNQHPSTTNTAPTVVSPVPPATHYSGPATHVSQDTCPVPLQEANINVPPPHFDMGDVASSDTIQGVVVDHNNEHHRGLTGHHGTSLRVGEWHPVNGGGGINSGPQHRTSSERSLEAARSKLGDRQSATITDRDYRIHSRSSSDRQPSRSPRPGVLDERSGRSGRDQDSTSSRGRSHTPASRSRSPSHSAHGRSISPERNRRDRTPTSINGYENLSQTRAQPPASRSPSVGPSSSLLPVKIEQSDSVPEGDILDDVSDISEGDIPDIPATSDKEADDLEEKQALAIDTASSDQINADTSEAALKRLVKAEDVEEISDEEAEWSDDGDCMYPLDFDVDFETEDWEDPIKIFDYFSPSLSLDQHLQYFTIRTFCEDSEQFNTHNEDSRKSQENSDETKLEAHSDPLAVRKILVSVEQLQTKSNRSNKQLQKEVNIGSDWVETIEKLTILLNDCNEYLTLTEIEVQIVLDAVKIGLSLDRASRQPKPTYKVRHLKSSLKLVHKMLILEQKNYSLASPKFVSLRMLLGDGMVQRALVDIFIDSYTASSMRLLVLQVLDLTMNCSAGLDWMLQRKKLNDVESTNINNTQGVSDQPVTTNSDICEMRTPKNVTLFEELLKALAEKHFSTRVKFAFTALVAKVNLNEAFQRLSELAQNVIQTSDVKLNVDMNDSTVCSDVMGGECSIEVIEDILNGLQQVQAYFIRAKNTIGQPKSTHFLPLSRLLLSQSEGKNLRTKHTERTFIDNGLNDPYPGYFFLLQMNKALNAILTFMSHPFISSNPGICAAVRALISSFLHHPVGLVFMAGGATIECVIGEQTGNEHFDTINSLIQILLQQSAVTEAAEQEGINQSEKSSSSVGLQLVHTIHALQAIDQLYTLCPANLSRKDLEKLDVLATIQALYGMTFNIAGRLAVVKLLTTGKNLEIIIRLVKHSGEVKGEGSARTTKKDMKKSAIRGYACELLLLVVRTSEDISYLNYFSSELLSIGRADETSKLHELISWIAPIEHLEMHHISPSLVSLSEVVKNNCENVSPMSHELVTAVRAIKCMCLPDAAIELADRDKGTAVKSERTFYTLPSLDFSFIQIYSSGLIDAYLTVLGKICGYHEQPHLHTATFVGHTGYVLLSVIKPIVHTLATVFGHLIASQDNGFRDIASINVLLRTFTLCTVVPTSSLCYVLSRTVCSDIMRILLTFTSTTFVQPTNACLQLGLQETSMVQEEGNGEGLKQMTLSSSLASASMWQKMVVEVMRYILSAPHTYTAGLRIFSELLPLSLPIQTKDPLLEAEKEKAENIRRLWSVHVYACEALVKEMVAKLGGIGSSCGALVHLLRRVCIQLADLSPPIAKLVTKAVIDGFKILYNTDMASRQLGQSANPSQSTEPCDKTNLCSSQTARMLNLLMWLLSNGSVKAAFIDLTSIAKNLDASGHESNGYDDFTQSLVRVLNTFPPAGLVCNKKEQHPNEQSHTLTQEYIVGIFQMLLDPEISLLPIPSIEGIAISESHLANSLPPPDQYSICLNGLFDYLCTDEAEHGFANLVPTLRTLVMITYQDYGLLKLKSALIERPGTLRTLLQKLICGFEGGNKLSNPDCFNALTATSELLRIIIGIAAEPDCNLIDENEDGSCKKSHDNQERMSSPTKIIRGVHLSKEDILLVFEWAKPEKQDTSEETEPEQSPIPTKSFSIGSLFGSLKKKNPQMTKPGEELNHQHPLVLLEQLLNKLTEAKVKKEGDGTNDDNDIDHVASAEAETDLIREQFEVVIQHLNNLAKDTNAEKEEKDTLGDVNEPEANLQDAGSLLFQFRQRPVFELIRDNNASAYNNGDDCSHMEADAVNEDERLNSSYWNVSTVEDGSSGENVSGTVGVTMDTDQSSCDKPVQVNLMELAGTIVSDPKEPFDIMTQVRQVCDEKSLFETDTSKQKKKPKKSLLEAKAKANKNLISTFKAGGTVPGLPIGRGRGFHRSAGQRLDAFRSRPANTSRPPSLHVDDFLLLQLRGQQPTGPTGYNRQSVKAAQELFAEREAKNKGAMVGFRDVTKQPVYCDEMPPNTPAISSLGAEKANSSLGWNIRGRMGLGPRGSSGYIRGQSRGSFGSFSGGRGGWNSYQRSDYVRSTGVPSGNSGNVSGMINQERRFSSNDGGAGNGISSSRRSTDRSSKDRTNGGNKSGVRR